MKKQTAIRILGCLMIATVILSLILLSSDSLESFLARSKVLLIVIAIFAAFIGGLILIAYEDPKDPNYTKDPL